MLCVHHEVGRSHFPAENEGNWPGEQAEQEQQTTEGLDNTAARNNGGRCTGIGKLACGSPSSFCVPCSTKTKQTTIRSTLSTLGPQTSSLFHLQIWATTVVAVLMIQLPVVVRRIWTGPNRPDGHNGESAL